MSLASDYATAQIEADAQKAAVTAAAPVSFIGPNGSAVVTPSGKLSLAQTTTGPFEISAAGALAFAAWINATFG